MTARLRVLQAFEPSAGGVPEHVRQLSAGLAARGHTVVVTGPPRAAVRPSIEAMGIAYVPLPWTGTVPAPRADIRVIRGVAAMLDEGSDVLHAHGQKAGLLLRRLASRRGVASVYTPHCFVYRTQLLRQRPGARLRYVANRAVERRLGPSTGLLVAVAHEEAEAAVADGVVPPERTRVVELGVAPDPSIPPDPDLARFAGEGPLFGFVAGLRDQKGLPTLLDALDRLGRARHAPRFAIVGDGPLRDEVARRIAQGPSAPTTTLRGFSGRVEPVLAALDVFVLPSRWEGMPIAVLEAMAMGLPVIATAVGGTPEAVTHGRTGLLVPRDDPTALAESIAKLASDPGARQRMGAAGRYEAENRFTLQRMVSDTEAVYASAISPDE